MESKLDLRTLKRMHENTKGRTKKIPLNNFYAVFKSRKGWSATLLAAARKLGLGNIGELRNRLGISENTMIYWKKDRVMPANHLLELFEDKEIEKVQKSIASISVHKSRGEHEKVMETLLRAERFLAPRETGAWKQVKMLAARGYCLSIIAVIGILPKDTISYYWANGDPNEVDKFLKTMEYHRNTPRFIEGGEDKFIKDFCDLTNRTVKEIKRGLT